MNQYYNKYAAAVYAAYPGAYGFPFSDREQIVLADLGGGVDTMRITVLSDTAAPSFLPVPGVLNPKTGTASFNLVAVFANDIKNHLITVGATACKAGWVNDYTTGPKTQIPQGDAAQILNCPAAEGWNRYDLLIGREKYLVIVKVTGGKIELATISGGGNSNWSAKDGNLYIGGLATYD